MNVHQQVLFADHLTFYFDIPHSPFHSQSLLILYTNLQEQLWYNPDEMITNKPNELDRYGIIEMKISPK